MEKKLIKLISIRSLSLTRHQPPWSTVPHLSSSVRLSSMMTPCSSTCTIRHRESSITWSTTINKRVWAWVTSTSWRNVQCTTTPLPVSTTNPLMLSTASIDRERCYRLKTVKRRKSKRSNSSREKLIKSFWFNFKKIQRLTLHPSTNSCSACSLEKSSSITRKRRDYSPTMIGSKVRKIHWVVCMLPILQETTGSK